VLDATFGVLALDATRVDGTGSLFDAAMVADPVASCVVAGATTTNIVERPGELAAAFCDGAEKLAQAGASIIVSNCGLSMVFQSQVGARTSLPTVMSSLLLVPILSRIFGRVGVLTYETGAMAGDGLRAECGWDDELDVQVADVRHLASWASLEGPLSSPLPLSAMREDLVEVAAGLVARGGSRVILIECTAMLPFIDEVRHATGLPVFDITGLIAYVRAEVDRATQ
jgi:aspartate/glutamate racemase